MRIESRARREAIARGEISYNKPKDNLTQSQVAKYLSYNPHTGVITRIFSESTRKDLLGHEAGSTCPAGYRRIRVCGDTYKAHRLAFLLHLGRWPNGVVDHINGNTSDNRWCNLRECTQAQNIQCARRSRSTKRNTSGFRGVFLHKPTGRWWANITVDGKLISLKYHDTPEEAWIARRKAELEYLGEFAPPNDYGIGD